jgi:phosphomannomutase
VAPLHRYYKTPETNFEVADKQGKMDELARRYSDAEIDYLDGITISYPDWWANVRPSNTEPFLRLVMEAKTTRELEERKAEIFGILGEPAE